MPDVRTVFLGCVAVAADLLARPEVAERWGEPSVLAGFAVSGLAGHLLRSAVVVDQYLDQAEPAGPAIGAAEYFVASDLSADIDDELNRSIRSRGEEMARGGPADLAAEAGRAPRRLATRLDATSAGRQVAVAGGLVLTVEEYLRTRIVELVVHTDDLAASVGVASPPPDPTAAGVAIEVLVGMARLRHGDLAVLHALARRERDDADALRAL